MSNQFKDSLQHSRENQGGAYVHFSRKDVSFIDEIYKARKIPGCTIQRCRRVCINTRRWCVLRTSTYTYRSVTRKPPPITKIVAWCPLQIIILHLLHLSVAALLHLPTFLILHFTSLHPLRHHVVVPHSRTTQYCILFSFTYCFLRHV